MSSKSSPLTIRLNPEIRSRMDAAREAAPYRPTVTAIVERGIVLACEEIEAMTKAASREKKP